MPKCSQIVLSDSDVKKGENSVNRYTQNKQSQTAGELPSQDIPPFRFQKDRESKWLDPAKVLTLLGAFQGRKYHRHSRECGNPGQQSLV